MPIAVKLLTIADANTGLIVALHHQMVAPLGQGPASLSIFWWGLRWCPTQGNKPWHHHTQWHVPCIDPWGAVVSWVGGTAALPIEKGQSHWRVHKAAAAHFGCVCLLFLLYTLLFSHPYIPGCTQGCTTHKYSHVVLKIWPMLYFTEEIVHPYRGTQTVSQNTCCTWAGETFFSSCAVVSVFWFLAGNRFWCNLLMYLDYYNTVVALC